MLIAKSFSNLNFLEIQTLVLLLIVIVTLIIDCRQTLRIKDTPGMRETNIILGPHPRDWAIVVYFSAWVAGLTALVFFYPFAHYVFVSMLIGGIIVLECCVICNNYILGLKL